tara:strand:+ start:1564 stop:2520 length:957 start_codon:yes stop_codon:yes gene_type:complete
MLKLKSLFKNILSSFIKKINNYFKKKKYLIIYRYGDAIGDHLYMTSVISKIYEKNFKIIVFSNYPELFENNPKIFKLFDLNKFFYKKILLEILKLIQGESIKSFRNKINGTKKYSFMKFYPKNIHLASASAYHFNMGLNYYDFKNEINLSNSEISIYKKKLNLPNNYAVIHSETKTNYTKNKNWGHQRIQNIVNEIDNIKWIQVGKPGEFELKNTYNSYFDLSLRELAYIISKSEFLVCMEGMYNHMASAVNKRNFLIHTGFLSMKSIKYSNTILVEKNSDLDCYPCYSLDCVNHEVHFDNYLTSDYVIDIIKKSLDD